MTQLHDAHFERDLRSTEATANKAVTLTLAAIAILLILVAVINFINFAFAEIPFRIKNINTRKVLGESRGSLIGRQLIHAGLIALVAFAIAALIMHVAAGTSWASHVSDSLALKDNIAILCRMMGIILFCAIVAGIFPALYSTAQPAALVLKGSYATSVRGKTLRNFMVSLQFFFSFILILMALFVGVQTRFMLNRDMGFSQEYILQVGCGSTAGRQHEALEAKLLQNPAIKEVTFADNCIVNDIFMNWSRTDKEGLQFEMDVLPVADDFVDFFGLQILEGRDFLPSDSQSESGAYIANETFMQGYPAYHIGSQISEPNAKEKGDLVGVVKDFHFRSLQHAMRPLVLYNLGKNSTRGFQVLYVKTIPGGDFKALSQSIKEAVCSFAPMMDPNQVDIVFLDEWIQSMYDEEQSLGQLITVASFVALLIALIGIIGLVFFETQFLRKEIAVRRVNGGTVGDILKMINKKYLIMAGVSFVIATPVAYWLMTAWREGFAYQSPVPVWIFIVALLAVTAITLAVVTLQSWRTANANPVESLKNE
ncbi:MAG: hypothetical protein IJ823_00455 [Bacteroidales bacterium]|nr:hypothetical protein [Bacteroidales bacterium]